MTANQTAPGANAVSFIHPDYACAYHEWKTIEDVCAGTTAVKQAGEAYLPKLSDMTQDEYDAYRKRAVFFNATRRTRDALSGLLMRKKAVITLPGKEDATQPLLADMTMNGQSIWQWIRWLSDQVVGTGRAATIIDYNEDQQRPYLATYQATDIVNWATGMVGGKKTLTLLIVREQEEILEGFTVKKRERYRSYRLVDGRAIYQTWAEGDKDGPQGAPEMPMLRRGKPLTRIPAVIHNASHLGPDIGEAPLYDVAEINLSHYRTSADLENGRHIAGLPTPWATGVDDSKEALHLGTSRAWTTEKADAKFGFLEFTGQGLGELTKAMEEKERQMAVLGARMLFDAKKDAESFDTVKLRAASENAALSNIAGHLSVTATEALQWYYWWQGTEAEPTAVQATVLINEDFIDTSIDAASLQAYVAAFQQNALSFEAFFYLLQKGEVYPEGWDMDKEAAAIAQRPPATAPLPPPIDPNKTPPGTKPGEPGKPGSKPEPKPGAGGAAGKKTEQAKNPDAA